MSYSFSVRGATIAIALAVAKVEMDRVVAAQPLHAHDAEAALATAKTMAELLPVDETQDVRLSLNGWLQWEGIVQEGVQPKFIGASVGASASLVAKE